MSACELYDTKIRALPAMERLRLASLILDDLAQPHGKGLDIQDYWTDEDVADLTKFSLSHSGPADFGEDAYA